MDKLNRVAHWIWDPVLVTVGWIAFLAGQSLQGDELIAKMTLLSAARVLPPGLVPARRHVHRDSPCRKGHRRNEPKSHGRRASFGLVRRTRRSGGPCSANVCGKDS